MLNIFIVDDEPIVREGLRLLLETADDMKVVGAVGSGEEAVEQAEQLNDADLLLLDIDLPAIDGVGTLAELRRRHCTVPVLMLTHGVNAGMIAKAMKAGASGYLEKGGQTAELFTAVRSVAAGQQHVSTPGTEKLLARAMGQAAHGEPPQLTRREREVLKLLLVGHTTKEIGVALHVSSSTAETHRRNILHKFDCRNTAEMVHYVTEHGLAEE